MSGARTLNPRPARRALRRARRRAFTLLETALAMVIIMVGVIAMVEAQRGFTMANTWSSHEATATYLAGEIRERMRVLPRHDPVTGLAIINNVVTGLGRETGEVTVNDLDDIDDYGALVFGAGGNFGGPIDAFGRVIPEVDENGAVKVNSSGQPIALQGWKQSVTVQKLDPFNYSSVVAWGATQAASGDFPGRAVDSYPLRVIITVSYQGPLDDEPQDITAVTWVVPASN